MPIVENIICPKIVTTVITRIGSQYPDNIEGSTIMPTDTKNIAPNIFFIGVTSVSIRSAETVPAIIDPARKAPRADENPILFAITTMRRHMPIDTTMAVSSFMSFLTFERNVGMRRIPTASHITRNKRSFPISPKSAVPETFCPAESVESMIIMKIPQISSITSAPSMTCDDRFSFSPYSSYDLRMIIVDDMEIIPPRNILSMRPQPKRAPMPNPTMTIAVMTVRAVTTAPAPMSAIFLKLNSRPKANMRNMIPRSAQMFISALSATVMSQGKLGPIRKPAMMYPSTAGRWIFLNKSVTMPAVTMMTARSVIRGASFSI